jgi:hypothetical protein
MKFLHVSLLLGALVALFAITAATAPPAKKAVKNVPNGIAMPAGFIDWRVVSSSHRTDNNTLRVILGNDIAVRAARSGNTHPWPDGAIMAKLVWQDSTHIKFPAATIPAKFLVAEFMIKDSKKYPDTGGWGFARWLGLDHIPYGKDASFAMECFNCHELVKDSDHVFTHPAQMP